jgi:hypothetical protein
MIVGVTVTMTVGAVTAIAGGMRHIIRGGDLRTTTTAATGIRNGTPTAGMTAGAGTLR